MAESLPTESRARKAAYRVGPARWAAARLRYVTGELSSFRAVAEWLTCDQATVWRKAQTESWEDQRRAHTERVTEQVERLGRGEGLELTAADVLSLTHTRAELARSALCHGAALSRALTDLLPRICSESDPDKLLTLARAQGLLLDQLCRLSGLPEPGSQPKPAQPKPAQSQPQGRVPVSVQSMSAEAVDGPSDEPAVGE